jgi:hypothetical protein
MIKIMFSRKVTDARISQKGGIHFALVIIFLIVAHGPTVLQ